MTISDDEFVQSGGNHNGANNGAEAPCADLEDGGNDEISVEDTSAPMGGAHATDRGIVPNENDILLGRGKPFQTSSGNRRMHRIISNYKAEYAARPRDQKRLFVETVLEAVLQDGTRFLRRVYSGHGTGFWEEVDRSMASEKVWHALRAKDRTKSDSCVDPSQESTHTNGTDPSNVTQHIGAPVTLSAEQTIHELACNIAQHLANATAAAGMLATMVGVPATSTNRPITTSIFPANNAAAVGRPQPRAPSGPAQPQYLSDAMQINNAFFTLASVPTSGLASGGPQPVPAAFPQNIAAVGSNPTGAYPAHVVQTLLHAMTPPPP